MFKGALLYATKNHFPNCMKMTGKMGGNKFAKPDSVSTPEYKFEAKVVVGGVCQIRKLLHSIINFRILELEICGKTRTGVQEKHFSNFTKVDSHSNRN